MIMIQCLMIKNLIMMQYLTMIQCLMFDEMSDNRTNSDKIQCLKMIESDRH